MIAWTLLDLDIYLPDILPDDAERQQDNAPDEPQGEHQRSPTRHGQVLDVRDQHIHRHANADKQAQQSHTDDPADRACREGSDTIYRQQKHRAQRVLRFPSDALTDDVVNCRRSIAQLRDDPTQIEIALGVASQSIQRTTTHQTEVRMIVNRTNPHSTLQAIECQCRGALQERICRA